jgi:hypothetical protein
LRCDLFVCVWHLWATVLFYCTCVRGQTQSLQECAVRHKACRSAPKFRILITLDMRLSVRIFFVIYITDQYSLMYLSIHAVA